jgi:cell division protein FtsB
MKSRLNKNKANIQKRAVKLFLVLGIGVLIITFFFGDHGIYHLYTIKSERNKIQKEIDYLRQQRVVLENEKTKLKTDFKYIEEMAREKYRMAKKGEKVFKVIEKKE